MLAERGKVRVDFRRGIQGTEVRGIRILHQEARAVTRERGVGENVTADPHVGGAVRAVKLVTLIGDSLDRQRGAIRDRSLPVDPRDDERAGVIRRSQAAEGEGHCATAGGREFDASAAGLHLEEFDRLNRVDA